jgi:hypothetical protein
MNPDTQVILVPDSLSSHIELRSDVEVIPARVTTYGHGKHVTYIILFVTGTVILG